MRACQACGVELVRQRAGARYCNDTCRQRGHRGPTTPARVPARTAPETRRRDIIRDRPPTPRPAQVMPVVTDKPPILRDSKAPSRPLDPRIVPDAKWPGMYRIKLRDGRLSDMVNLTRAHDALLRETPWGRA